MNENFEEKVKSTREQIYSQIKEEINTFKPTKLHPQPTSICTLVPTTELEKCISAALKPQNVDIALKLKEKNFLFDFDRKMKRIKKIKSRKYRKQRRIDKKKAEGLVETDDSSEEDEESVSVEVDEEFVEEKKKVVEEEKPVEKKVILAGWGSWAGEGIEVKENKINVIVQKRAGLEFKDRMDKKLPHVIINESGFKNDEKYKINIPKQYTKKEYFKKFNAPISKECNSLRIFNKFVKSKTDNEIDIVEEFHYEKQNDF